MAGYEPLEDRDKWVVTGPNEVDPTWTVWAPKSSSTRYTEFDNFREAFDYAFEQASK